MSFKANIEVGGKVLNIVDLSYALNQEVDATGRPSSITRGGTITVTVESTADSFFFEWVTNNFERKDGSVIFTKRDTDAKLKELKFKEAYLVSYKETFDSTGTKPLVETFTLSAKELELGGGKHTNEWV